MTDDKTTVEMPRPKITERPASDRNGWAFLGLALALILLGAAAALAGVAGGGAAAIAGGAVIGSLLALAGLVVAAGLTPVAPGEARVLQLLGRYKGTVRNDGLRWVNPLTLRQKVSTRIRNHETGLAKVNDAGRQPHRDLRRGGVAGRGHRAGRVRGGRLRRVRRLPDRGGRPAHRGQLPLRRRRADSRCATTPTRSRPGCRRRSSERVASAGVEIIESRITGLAYAPEIAQAMLRRQQAGAVVAARQRIVEGAVGMVRARPRPAGGGPRRRAGRGAQGGHGQQPAGRAVRRPRRPAGGQLRHASTSDPGRT